jgi:hypothetical protein
VADKPNEQAELRRNTIMQPNNIKWQIQHVEPEPVLMTLRKRFPEYEYVDSIYHAIYCH